MPTQQLLELEKYLFLLNVDLQVDLLDSETVSLLKYADTSLSLEPVNEALQKRLKANEKISEISSCIEECIKSMPAKDLHKDLLMYRYCIGHTLAKTAEKLQKPRLDSQHKTAVSAFVKHFDSLHPGFSESDEINHIKECIEKHFSNKQQLLTLQALKTYLSHVEDYESDLIRVANELEAEHVKDMLLVTVTKRSKNIWNIECRQKIPYANSFLLLDKDLNIIDRKDRPSFTVIQEEKPDYTIRPASIDSHMLLFTLTNSAKKMRIKTSATDERSGIISHFTNLCICKAAMDYLDDLDSYLGTNRRERIEQSILGIKKDLSLKEDLAYASMLLFGITFDRISK